MSNYIYGKNSVYEALKSGRVLELYVLNNYKELKSLNGKGVKITCLKRPELDKLANTVNHQGIVAKIKDYPLYEVSDLLKKENGLIVILDGIEDPHNLGAIMRTVDCVGADGIIYRKHHNVSLTPTVAKVSTGAIEHVKVAEVSNLVNTLNYLKKQGYWIVGTDIKADRYYNEMNYDMNIALVMGAEGKGMARLTKEACDFLVKMPLLGHVDSLNVSNAAAIMLYKILENRQSIHKCG